MAHQAIRAASILRTANRPMTQWFFRHSRRRPGDARDPRIAQVRADLRRMPPTTVILAEIDPLRSDGEPLGARLRHAGVPVRVHVHEALPTSFSGWEPSSPARVAPFSRRARGCAARSGGEG